MMSTWRELNLITSKLYGLGLGNDHALEIEKIWLIGLQCAITLQMMTREFLP